MIFNAFDYQITILDVLRRRSCEYVIVPKVAFKSNQFFLVVHIPHDVANDGLLFAVAIQTTEEHVIDIHNRHIVTSLDLVVDGYSFNTVYPPMVCCIVVRRLDFKNRRFTVWHRDKIVHVCQHKRILWMIKHLLDLIDFISCSHMEYFCHQVLKEMSHLFLYPVFFGILVGYDL